MVYALWEVGAIKISAHHVSGVLIIKIGHVIFCVELEADYRSYGSPAITHKRAEHLAHKPINWIYL